MIALAKEYARASETCTHDTNQNAYSSPLTHLSMQWKLDLLSAIAAVEEVHTLSFADPADRRAEIIRRQHALEAAMQRVPGVDLQTIISTEEIRLLELEMDGQAGDFPYAEIQGDMREQIQEVIRMFRKPENS